MPKEECLINYYGDKGSICISITLLQVVKVVRRIAETTGELSVETATRLAFSERTGIAAGGRPIGRVQGVYTDLKCD